MVCSTTEPEDHHNLLNEEISTNRRTSSSLPNKYNKYNQNQQNNRITRETITDDLYRYTWEPTKKVFFNGCASSASYPTKTIFVTKQVKLIKQYGFSMNII